MRQRSRELYVASFSSSHIVDHIPVRARYRPHGKTTSQTFASRSKCTSAQANAPDHPCIIMIGDARKEEESHVVDAVEIKTRV